MRFSPAELPIFVGSQTELVQIWVNILKNACDAMINIESPTIEIHTRVSKGKILVTIANNGPEIDEPRAEKYLGLTLQRRRADCLLGWGLGSRSLNELLQVTTVPLS